MQHKRLTPRQQQVLELVFEGHDSLHIARQLKVSKRTIDFHVTDVLERFQCHNTRTAIYKALMLGILTVPKPSHVANDPAHVPTRTEVKHERH